MRIDARMKMKMCLLKEKKGSGFILRTLMCLVITIKRVLGKNRLACQLYIEFALMGEYLSCIGGFQASSSLYFCLLLEMVIHICK